MVTSFEDMANRIAGSRPGRFHLQTIRQHRGAGQHKDAYVKSLNGYRMRDILSRPYMNGQDLTSK
jgi:hypothetical protein